ncbi:MAG: hypothetical protein E6R03_07790 [Hyphomicrobiaceae bacterium]|nr:MAG: hypothetical protein E6R03_07790 [Hyphomicrobiaceae bacterium]
MRWYSMNKEERLLRDYRHTVALRQVYYLKNWGSPCPSVEVVSAYAVTMLLSENMDAHVNYFVLRSRQLRST